MKISKKQLSKMINDECNQIKIPDLAKTIKNRQDFPKEAVTNAPIKKHAFKLSFSFVALACILILCCFMIPSFFKTVNPGPIETDKPSSTKTQLMVQATSLFNLAFSLEDTSMDIKYFVSNSNINYDENSKEILEYLEMVEQFFNDDNSVYTITKLENEKYQYKGTISVNINGLLDKYTMYFNETPLDSKEDDDDIDEISSKLEGIIKNNLYEFKIEGIKEVEQDECEVELKLYLDDDNNFIIMNQEIENRENEYSYEVYENGQCIKKIEIEVNDEKGVGKKTIELTEEDMKAKIEKEFSFEFNNGIIECSFEDNEVEIDCLITMTEDYYIFNYKNGIEFKYSRKKNKKSTNKNNVSFVL